MNPADPLEVIYDIASDWLDGSAYGPDAMVARERMAGILWALDRYDSPPTSDVLDWMRSVGLAWTRTVPVTAEVWPDDDDETDAQSAEQGR